MKTNKLLMLSTLIVSSHISVSGQNKPNIIIIMTDDQGYQDLGCYNSPLIKTPCIDKMANEGLRLTDYYVSASVSSASRAGLLTGKYNTHNKVTSVLWPGDEGLPSNEITIAEELKEYGYVTACFGKWHLGDADGHLPISQGFDIYYGIPYSNDMFIGPTQKIAKDAVFREGWNREKTIIAQKFVKDHTAYQVRKTKLKGLSPLMEQDEIVEFPCDQTTLTQRYFDKAIDFIDKCGNTPFFIYLTPNMPHVPLYASNQFKGKSARGLYGDVVEEIDWNVGRLLDFVDKKGLNKKTLVVFTSDNGPWLEKKEDGGSALPLRDGKRSHYEGGVRTPCIIRWLGHVPSGVSSNSIFVNIDWLPTILDLIGGYKPQHKVDGMNLSAFLVNPSLKLRNEYLYVKDGKVHGIRKGDWIYLPKSGMDKPKKNDGPELFNVRFDLSENQNLHFSYPNKVKKLKKLMKNYETKWNNTFH